MKITFACTLGLLVASALRLPAITADDLRCEYLKNPLGVDVNPRLSWVIGSDRRGEVQTAYEIKVSHEGMTQWDSGRIASSDTNQIEYAGPALAPDAVYNWTVRVWDRDGVESAPSAPASFATGLTDWNAQWIARRPEDEWSQAWAKRRAQEAADPHWLNSRDPMDWLRHDPGPKNDPAPLLRKEFTVAKPVKEARLYVTGVGNYELYLNGKRIDGGALAPGFTDYNKHVLYNTYDVGSALQVGPNTIGLMLGRGWYNEIINEVWNFSRASWVGQPKAIAHLTVTYADGSQDTVVSDASWKVADGPLLFDDLRGGEVYDATKEIPGWDTTTFDDSSWLAASVVPAPKGKLRSELMEPMRPTAEFKPMDVTQPEQTKTEKAEVTQKVQDAVTDKGLLIHADASLTAGDPAPNKVKTLRVEYLQNGKKQTAEATEGSVLEIKGPLTVLKAEYGDLPSVNTWLFRFPQDIAGHARFTIHGTGLKGQVIKLSYYPFRYADGRLNAISGPQVQYYICRGAPEETMELHFTYFGARYVLVNGLNYQPKAGDMTLIQRRSALEEAGTFATSDPLLNHVQSNIHWTEASAMHSLPQDCWTREKLGWTGDTKATAEVALFNFGMAPLYTKYLMDHRDNQSASGGISAYVPNCTEGNESVTWDGTIVVLPWLLYEYYGDKRILAENYDTASRYLAAAPKGDKPLIYSGGPADWCPPWAKTPQQIPDDPELGVPVGTFPGDPEGNTVYGTAHFYQVAKLMAKIAGVLGKPDDVVKWNEQADAVGQAFNANFFDSATATYHGDRPSDYRQSANAQALWFHLVPEERRREVLDHLVGDIVARENGHLNSGVLGTQALFEGLPEAGRSDIAYEMLTQKTYPGYMWPILRFGLTTLPEHWEGFGTHEHPMLGSGGAFLFKRLAGILPDPMAPGFAHFEIRPSIDNPLQDMKSSYRSIRGMICSEWHKQGAKLVVDVQIPPNTKADVFVPKYGYDRPQISESGKPAWLNGAAESVAGCDGAKDAGDAIDFSLGGGVYHFVVTAEEPLAVGRAAGLSINVPDTIVYPGESAEVQGTIEGPLGQADHKLGRPDGLVFSKVESLTGHAFTVRVSVAASQSAWSVLDVPLNFTGQVDGKTSAMAAVARLLVRPAVEIRYPTTSWLVAPGYAGVRTLFYMRNERSYPVQFHFSTDLPAGWTCSFVGSDGQPLSAKVAPNEDLKVQAVITPPAGTAEGATGTAHVRVSDGHNDVANLTFPWTSTGSVLSQFTDDLAGPGWTLDPSLTRKTGGDGVTLSSPSGASSMTSGWMVLDFSKPLQIEVNVKSASKGAKWALYVEDEAGANPAFFWDTSQIGSSVRPTDSLPWTSLHRFRWKIFSIGGDVTFNSISIRSP